MRRLIVPVALSVVALGCPGGPELDASMDAASDVREAGTDAPTDLARDDVTRDAGDAYTDVAMEAAAPDTDDGIRCTDPRYDDAGTPLCGYCSYPDGAPIGCARCPDGGDAGKISLC